MGEIEKRRREVFMETFCVINSNFKSIFEKLANGDARLVLEDPEAPLDSGLILEANPSGKTIKRIESMSGGEKALTAMAFLFAIQQYEPSPFYLIDEADAALDIRNSSKVADMFINLSDNTQFIVVSHNAPVIRKCDQMVGVTMDETGTSIVEISMPEDELVNRAVAKVQTVNPKA
jgi:chromosome segregation protein